MHAFIRKVIPLAITLGAAAASSGCTENNVTIFIRQVQIPDAEDKCVVQADPAAVALLYGRLDASFGFGYEAFLLVGNQMGRRGDADTLRPESGRVQLYEAEVEVFDFQGASLAAYTTPTAGFVDPATGTDPGWGLASVTLVDAGSAAAVAAGGTQVLVSRVKLFGTSLGGEDVETGYWDYPIEVCNGCYVTGCVEPDTCEDDRLKVCHNKGQDAAPDCRDVDPNHSCNTP